MVTVAPSVVAPYVAGLGCRAGCSEAELRQLLEHSLAAHGLALRDLSGLASVAHKRDEPGLMALATDLGLPLAWLAPSQLETVQDRVSQGSPLVLQVTGAASVAEACALAQVEALSGQRAALRIGKQRSANATVAVAGTEELHT